MRAASTCASALTCSIPRPSARTRPASSSTSWRRSNPYRNASAAVGRGFDEQRGVDGFRALAHGAQSPAPALLRCIAVEADAVVHHSHLNAGGERLERDFGPRRVRVLGYV